MLLDIYADITGLSYTPLLCRELDSFDFDQLGMALSSRATFKLFIGRHEIVVSWWDSTKRTGSYPYARVYDSLKFAGKPVTIIPIIKDEGKKGNKYHLEWDTVSLMGLLGVYVIISYYKRASKNPRCRDKIIRQRFDIEHIKSEIEKLLFYQSDALRWNLSQVDKVGELSKRALNSYNEISKVLGVEMHSPASALRRIELLSEGKEDFMKLSRDLSMEAQERESVTIQPKEKLEGVKAKLTIKNYLGGYYYLTCDEVEIHGKTVYLIEGKHTRVARLPSLGGIKDGLLRMMIYTNLKNVTINGKRYSHTPILKLTTEEGFNIESLSDKQRETLEILVKEANANGFRLLINNQDFVTF
nr:hypothetical protein [Candidatus Freyarchaeota archaeon]